MTLRVQPTRRDFVAGSASTIIAALAVRASASEQQAQSEEPATLRIIPTRDSSLKFHRDGTPKPFAGNTIICHIQQEGDLRDAISLLANELRNSRYANKLGILPSHSYHMTVFPGVNDQDRQITGWPSYVPAQASIADCNRLIEERMRTFRLGCELPLRMKIDLERTVTYGRASTLRLIAIDSGEDLKIRKLRDRLITPYGFSDKNHDKYSFHITLAYEMARLSESERTEYQGMLRRTVSTIIEAAPVIEFGNPEFCTFQDMYRFDIVTLLQT